MEKFLVRHVAEAAKEAGLDKVERRRLIEEGDDYVNEMLTSSHLKKTIGDEDKKYYSGERVYNSDKFFDFMEGGKEDRRVALGLGSVLRKYGSKEKGVDREKLTADEGRLVSVAVKYFEDWFYRGTFLKKFKWESNTNNYHAISAFIVNQLAKIKELRENSGLVEGFDTQKLERLIEDVEIFSEEYLTEENLNQRVEERENVLKTMKEELQSLQTKAEPFDQKIWEIEKKFKSEYAKIYDLLKMSGSNPEFSADEKDALQRLYAILEQFDRSSFHSPNQTEIQSILLNSNGSLLRALRRRINYDSDFDFEDDDKNKKMQNQNILREVDRIEIILQNRLKLKNNENSQKQKTGARPQKVSGFAALGGLKESIGEKEIIRLLEGLVGDSYGDTRKALDKQYELRTEAVGKWDIESKKSAIRKMKLELQSASVLLYSREKVSQILKNSIISIKESLKRPAGDLYLLKTIIIASAEQASHDKDKKFPYFNPDNYVDTTSRRDAVFDFLNSHRVLKDNEYGRGSDYMKVHFEPAHISFAQFAVEFMKNKCGKF